MEGPTASRVSAVAESAEDATVYSHRASGRMSFHGLEVKHDYGLPGRMLQRKPSRQGAAMFIVLEVVATNGYAVLIDMDSANGSLWAAMRA